MSVLEELKEQIKSETRRAYGLKTKKAQAKAWSRVRNLRLEAFALLRDECSRYGAHSIRATVRRFTPRDDNYMVDTPYGTMWLDPSSDVLSKSWYAGTCCIEYDKGQQITLEVTFEVDHQALCIYVVPGHVTGGRVNQEQYAELDKRTDLAFFKHSTGGMTGLFSSGGSL